MPKVIQWVKVSHLLNSIILWLHSIHKYIKEAHWGEVYFFNQVSNKFSARWSSADYLYSDYLDCLNLSLTHREKLTLERKEGVVCSCLVNVQLLFLHFSRPKCMHLSCKHCFWMFSMWVEYLTVLINMPCNSLPSSCSKNTSPTLFGKCSTLFWTSQQVLQSTSWCHSSYSEKLWISNPGDQHFIF